MTSVDVIASLDAPCRPEDVFARVEDLASYPAWLSILPRAEVAPAHPADSGPAWSVELRGRLGPLARSKRLRMVRTDHRAPKLVRFERRELDGRRHSPWRLEAEVTPTDGGGGTRLEMRLHYGGGFAASVIERLLVDEIEQSRPRLLALLGGRADSGPDDSCPL